VERIVAELAAAIYNTTTPTLNYSPQCLKETAWDCAGARHYYNSPITLLKTAEFITLNHHFNLKQNWN